MTLYIYLFIQVQHIKIYREQQSCVAHIAIATDAAAACVYKINIIENMCSPVARQQQQHPPTKSPGENKIQICNMQTHATYRKVSIMMIIARVYKMFHSAPTASLFQQQI